MATVIGSILVTPIEFGGRVTLTAGTPVMTADATAQTVLRYTPYISDRIPLFNGNEFVPYRFTADLTNDTTASSSGSAGPAACTTNSNYDLFLWDLAGALIYSRGPLWTSATGRGTGAGTSELVRVQGVLLNAVAITNGPAAQRGTWVGTFKTNGSSQVDWQYGSFASNWGKAVHNVWNMYNRVKVAGALGDTAASWTYNSTTIRQANAKTNAQVDFVVGLNEDTVRGHYGNRALVGASSAFPQVGVGLDSTSAMSGVQVVGNALAATYSEVTGEYVGLPGLGFHFMSANEACGTSQTITFLGGQAGPPAFNHGMTYELRM